VNVIGPLRLRPARAWHGPYIACGDTTGFLDPFTGEGMTHAVASAIVAAQAVRRSLDGDRSAFANYEREVLDLRRAKGPAARLLFGLVRHRRIANATASVIARSPRLANGLVRFFGDQL
jgi:menaquinone-9 beta-reductase